MRRKGLIIGSIAVLTVATAGLVALSGGSSGDTTPGAVHSTPAPAGALLTNAGAVDESDPAKFIEANGEAYDTPVAMPEATGAPIGDPRLEPGVGGVGGTGAGAGGPTSAGSAPALQTTIDRKIIRNATLDITVDDVPAAVARVTSEASGNGGFVSSSIMTIEAPATEDEPARQRATVQIRVPAETYETVMNNLRGIADEITSEQSQTSEVTEEYTDLEAQLRNLQATEQQYLGLMAQATTVTDILTVTDRLNGVRLQIEQVQGRLQLLDDLTDLATITVNIALPPPAAELVVEEPAEPNWARQAWDDAWEASEDALREIGRTGIIAGVVMIWIVVPVAVLALAWWILGGRRHGGSPTSA